MSNNFIVTIPARYKSTRLPGKPLKKINGKAMIHHVWDACIKAVNKKNVIVLTDDKLIRDYCNTNKINFFMTSKKCKTGSDRIYEFAKIKKYKFYINVQGDEPLLNPKNIREVINFTIKYNCVTNCYSNCSNLEYKNINIPKVVLDNNDFLLYMSRSPIPSHKKKKIPTKIFKQICIYGFPYKYLMEFGKLNKKSKNELIEDIEIIRFLDIGIKIKMINVKDHSLAVDTPGDLKKVRKIFEDRYKKS